MYYITIRSECQFGIEHIDEIETTLDLSYFPFKEGDTLKMNSYYPERRIITIEVKIV